jgi:hypothetical protein
MQRDARNEGLKKSSSAGARKIAVEEDNHHFSYCKFSDIEEIGKKLEKLDRKERRARR